jgi:hypothetical protein
MKKIAVFLLFFAVLSLKIAGKPRLIEYGLNHYSQFGEDGIIAKIYEVIGTGSKIAVEFGAWDGFHFSNTATLWAHDKSWKGILIEGDAKRFQELQKNIAGYNCVAINAMVGIKKDDCLETILKKQGITQEIDLLSIDIDGNDYHIFESLKKIRPRVIVIEYNPTIPVWYDLYAPYCSKNNFGQSVGALNRIAEKKGYALIALTRTNAFYVKKTDFAKFAEFETDLSKININDGYIVMVTTYDGKYALVKNKVPQYIYGIADRYEGTLEGECVRCDKHNMALGITIHAGGV